MFIEKLCLKKVLIYCTTEAILLSASFDFIFCLIFCLLVGR